MEAEERQRLVEELSPSEAELTLLAMDAADKVLGDDVPPALRQLFVRGWAKGYEEGAIRGMDATLAATKVMIGVAAAEARGRQGS